MGWGEKYHRGKLVKIRSFLSNYRVQTAIQSMGHFEVNKDPLVPKAKPIRRKTLLGWCVIWDSI